MEIAAANDIDLTGFIVNKDQRIIGDRIKLKLDEPFGVGDRVAARSVDLRHAAKRIGVLHVRRIEIANKLALREDRPKIPGAIDLPRVRPQGVDTLVEGRDRAVQCLKTQAAGDVSNLGETLGPPRSRATRRRSSRSSRS